MFNKNTVDREEESEHVARKITVITLLLGNYLP